MEINTALCMRCDWKSMAHSSEYCHSAHGNHLWSGLEQRDGLGGERFS